MEDEYKHLIAEYDKTLQLLRKEWIDAALKDKEKWTERIDCALDERSRLMKLRDKVEKQRTK
jgi:hypothetical protein